MLPWICAAAHTECSPMLLMHECHAEDQGQSTNQAHPEKKAVQAVHKRAFNYHFIQWNLHELTNILTCIIRTSQQS